MLQIDMNVAWSHTYRHMHASLDTSAGHSGGGNWLLRHIESCDRSNHTRAHSACALAQKLDLVKCAPRGRDARFTHGVKRPARRVGKAFRRRFILACEPQPHRG